MPEPVVRLPPWSSADGRRRVPPGRPPTRRPTRTRSRRRWTPTGTQGSPPWSSADANADGPSEVDTRAGRSSPDGPDAASAVPPTARAAVTVAAMMRSLRMPYTSVLFCLTRTTVPGRAISGSCGNTLRFPRITRCRVTVTRAPPSGERSTVSVPPTGSTVRRTMSRPRPVEPAPLHRAARGRVRTGAGVLPGVPPTVERDRERRCPPACARRRCPAGRPRTRAGPRRRPRPGRAGRQVDRPAAAGPRRAGPRTDPFGDDRGRVTGRGHRVRAGRRASDDRVDDGARGRRRAAQAPARGLVDAPRRRGAAPSRACGAGATGRDRVPLGTQEVADPCGQLVERSGRPRGPPAVPAAWARASSSPPASRSATSASSGSGARPAAEPVCDERARAPSRRSRAGQNRPTRRAPRGAARPRHEDPDDHGPSAGPARRRGPPAVVVSTVKLVVRAAQHDRGRGPREPTVPPSGRYTVTGRRGSTLTCSTAQAPGRAGRRWRRGRRGTAPACGGGHGPVRGHVPQQQRQRNQEREQHQGHRRGHQQRQPPALTAGAGTPDATPRTVCRWRGSCGRLTQFASQPRQVHVDRLSASRTAAATPRSAARPW